LPRDFFYFYKFDKFSCVRYNYLQRLRFAHDWYFN